MARLKRKSPKQTLEAKAKRKAVMEANRLVKVYLRMSHTIRGVVYGPGSAKLPNALASSLLSQESHTLKVEEAFTHGRRGVLIGGRSRSSGIVKTIDVPYETFDTSISETEGVPLEDLKAR